MNVYPFIEAEKVQAAQRQAGVRAAGGLPFRLLRSTAPTRPRPSEHVDDAELTDAIVDAARRVQGPLRRTADPRRAAPTKAAGTAASGSPG